MQPEAESSQNSLARSGAESFRDQVVVGQQEKFDQAFLQLESQDPCG